MRTLDGGLAYPGNNAQARRIPETNQLWEWERLEIGDLQYEVRMIERGFGQDVGTGLIEGQKFTILLENVPWRRKQNQKHNQRKSRR